MPKRSPPSLSPKPESRFFYLPDKRPFFAVNEISGILDDNNVLISGHYQAYLKEGEKLASIRQE
jgi:hypothetical protein